MMTNTKLILQQLAKDFPNAKSELDFRTPFELLVAVILSAQCTDKRVNTVTPALFKVAPDAQSLAVLPLEQIEQIIHPCGFYHSKAKYLKQMATDLVNRFGGQVPNDWQALQTLSGVGRKTANVVYAFAFGGQAIAVDTHVFRVSNRLGMVSATNVLDTEKQLMQAIPKEQWADAHHYILLHGRYVCKAQTPNCTGCSVQGYCKFYRQKQRESALVEASKCLGCKVTKCQQNCPLHNDIPQIIHLVKQDKWQDAQKLVGHPFGEICSYVCPHERQCVGNCVVGTKGNAVNFSQIERTLFSQYPFEWNIKSNLLQGKTVAVVGGGVAGITFASKMYQNGARVTVFEMDKLLATLYDIPDYRLPKQAIGRILANIPAEVEIVYEQIDEPKLALLQQTYDYVYLSVGAMQAYVLGVEGDNLATTAKQCLAGNVKGDVVVVGGGNTAVDCATYAKSLGCNVTVAYRRAQKDMPAFESEIAYAKNQGVKFLFNVAPTLLAKGNGGLTLTLAKTVSNGRQSLQITDKTLTISCHHVVSAVGASVDKSLFGGAKPTPDEHGQISNNTLIGGDATGAGLVANAVRDALNTANYILETR